MIKRIFAMVLSVVMVLSLLPVALPVSAEGAEHIHCMCGKTTTKDATCASCGTKGVVWTGIEAMSAVTAPGNYYLKKDVTADPVEYTSGEYAFCLCGNEMHAGSQGKRMFNVKNEGTKLTITDCGTTGTITGITGSSGTGSLLRVGSGAEVNLYGGTITGNTDAGNKKFNGMILAAETGVFNMYGGEISNNESGRGAIYVQDAGSVARLLGGVITGNTGKNAAGAMAGGGGVYGMKGTVELGGTIQIYGNIDQDTTRNSDVHIRNDQGCKLQLSATKPLENGAKVNYGLASGGTQADNYGITVSAAPADWSSTWVRYNGTKLGYSEGKFFLDTSADHIHCMCGKEKTDGATCAECKTKAVEWIGTDTMPTTDQPGNYYLTGDVSTTEVNYSGDKRFSICLHGNDITSTNGYRILQASAGATVSITDCDGTGTITGCSKTKYGSTLRANANGVLQLYGGKITGNHFAAGDAVIYADKGTATDNGGTFIMYGGEISGNTTKRGTVYGCLATDVKPATIKILGGTITGNEAQGTGGTYGGAGVLAFDTVEIGGKAKIYGNTATKGPADLFLRNDYSGKLVISSEVPLEDGANVCYGLMAAEADTTNLKSITGTPETWSNQWVKLGEDKVGYQDGKFLIDNTAAAEHIHCLCGAEINKDATCSVCGSKAVVWTGTNKLPTKNEPGYYYLTGDVATPETNYVNGTFGICLNGHALKSAAGGRILQSYKDAIVHITDCGTTGTITGATGTTKYGCTMRVNMGGVLNLWNGHVTGNKSAAEDDGIIYVDGSNNTAVAGGTFVMYGGKISGNTTRRGAVYGVSTGTPGPVIKILGGEITGNTGTGTSSRKGGAGVCSFFPVEVGGSAKIYGNTAKEGPADLYLRNDTANGVTYTGKVIVSAQKPLTDGANIQYALAAADADAGDLKYITGTPASWDKTWVTYDGEAVDYENGKFFTKRALIYAEHDHDNKKWISATQANGQLSGEDGCYVLESDVKLDKTIYIAKDNHVQLCLNGHTLTAADQAGHFDVQGGGKLTVCDCTAKTVDGVYTAGKITGGNGKSGGSMRVRSGAQMHLIDGIFTGNACATGGNGGVVYADAGAYIRMTGGQMCGNTGAMGGAVRLGAPNVGSAGATFILEGGSICHNESINMGGGVYAAGGADIQLKGGSIAYNKAAQGGGGICVNSQGINGTQVVTVPSTITLTGTTIQDNSATTWGGSVYIKTGTVLNMQGGIITGGSSKIGAGVLLESEGTTLNLSAGQITGNHAGTAGSGGVYASNKTVVNMTGGEISNNTAEAGPGGMTIYAATGNLTGGVISGNTATGSGAGLSIAGSKVYLGKVTITGNSTTGSAGGVYVSRAGSICSDVTIDGAQILKNTCANSGGGIFMYMNGNQITMKDGLIAENQAKDGGGVVAQREVTFTLEGGEIKGNKSVNSGGGYYASIDSTFIMNGGKITGNYAGRNGGGVYSLRSKVTLKGGTISGNSAKTTAGGVYFSGVNGTICGTSITGNKALEGSGGGVFVQAVTNKVNGVNTLFPAKVVMTSGIISYNTTPKAAAGLLLQKENTVFEFRGGSISHNTATKFAGGVYVGKGSTFNMYGGSIANNATEIDVAGGIRVDNGTANIVGGEIRGNKTTRSAGGLLCSGADAKVNLGKVKIYENEAKVGAGMVAQGKSQVIADGTEIYHNVATQEGGGVYVYSYTNTTFKNCKFYENTAGKNGGALWTWATSNTTTENCEFTNNVAGEQGGAIWTRGDAMIVNGGVFTGNKAEKDKGGAVFAGLMGAVTAREVPCLQLNNALFDKNEAGGQGGAVYVSVGAEVHMDTVTLTGNKAVAEGGALWAKDETTLRNVTATGNMSGGEGFAIYLEDAEYDGESFFYGLMTISGDMKVHDNQGGDMYLGSQTPMVVADEGLGKDTLIHLTMHDGYLTQWVWGAYNYEGGDQVYTITYGDRSLTDPEYVPAAAQSAEADTEQTAQGGNTMLYVGVGVFAAAAVAVVLLVLLKKKKTAEKANKE